MSTYRLLTFVFSLGLVGCVAPDPDAGVVVEDDADTKADVVRPHGAYAGNGFEYFNEINLAADHTYYWNSDVDGSEGTYRFGKSGTRRYVDLSETGNPSPPDCYEYKLDGATLKVRHLHATDWETLTHTGSEGENCTNDPNSIDPICDPGLVCDSHAGCLRMP